MAAVLPVGRGGGTLPPLDEGDAEVGGVADGETLDDTSPPPLVGGGRRTAGCGADRFAGSGSARPEPSRRPHPVQNFTSMPSTSCLPQPPQVAALPAASSPSLGAPTSPLIARIFLACSSTMRSAARDSRRRRARRDRPYAATHRRCSTAPSAYVVRSAWYTRPPHCTHTSSSASPDSDLVIDEAAPRRARAAVCAAATAPLFSPGSRSSSSSSLSATDAPDAASSSDAAALASDASTSAFRCSAALAAPSTTAAASDDRTASGSTTSNRPPSPGNRTPFLIAAS
mmetsp:Transcript_2415/g.7690  ORF Transcript_2415/g.7690 Transcript_2415/m.7690 type:complete len:285 (-) Transcript_2415:510-1364(-)